VVFVATAAVVPLLISPSRTPAASAPTTSQATTSATPTATPTTTPSPTPTPSPTATASRFLVSPPVKPRPVGNPPHEIYREFESTCSVARSGTKVPLQGVAAAGKTVQYLSFGSTSTKLAEPGKVPTGSTSCVAAGDRSSYWVPALYQGKQIIRPDEFTVLYKSAVDDYTSVQPFPAGLRMIVGGPGAGLTTPAEGEVSWSCGGYSGTDLPTSCPAGQGLTLRMSAPGCWDGRHLDVAGHRNHLAWALRGRCPASHPVAIPALLVRIIYPMDGSGTLRLASGPADEFGFGFVSGWQRAALAKLVRTCINAAHQCDTYGNP
jgi:hypothetical protein